MPGEDRLDGPPGIARRTAHAAVGHGESKEVGVKPLPCCGEGCLDATRELFEEALRHGPGVASGRRGDAPEGASETMTKEKKTTERRKKT
jgi:hypothetical protein